MKNFIGGRLDYDRLLYENYWPNIQQQMDELDTLYKIAIDEFSSFSQLLDEDESVSQAAKDAWVNIAGAIYDETAAAVSPNWRWSR